jgi:transcriptional regulator with XRE-family HTH domain
MDDMRLRSVLAANLRREMSVRSLTQVELSRRCDIAQPHISALLNEKSSTTIDTVERIASALDISAASLLLPISGEVLLTT